MDRPLYRRWIFANALGELVGLGTTFAIGAAMISWLNLTPPMLALTMVAAGTFEGLVLGIAQGQVIHQALPAIARRRWLVATLIGTLSAWFLGMIPSTLMALETAAAVAVEPPMRTVIALAATMGLGLGLVLAWPQWWVLRACVPRAWRWLPANAAAWMVGMVLLFMAIDAVQPWPLAAQMLGMAVALTATGAMVGAIHGWILVRLVTPWRQRPR